MTGGQKFLFETSFDPEQDERLRARKKPPEPTYTAADLAKAEQDGLARGRAEGAEETRNGVEQAARAALERIGEHLPGLFAAVAEDSARRDGEAIDLTLRVVRKMLPELERRHGLAETEAVLRDCLERRRGEPRLVVRTSDAVHELVRGCTEELAQELGFEGKLVFLTEEKLGPSDVRVEWADGGVERDTEALWTEIDRILAGTLGTHRAPADPAETAPIDPSPASPPAAAPAGDAPAMERPTGEPRISEDTIVGEQEPPPPLKQEPSHE